MSNDIDFDPTDNSKEGTGYTFIEEEIVDGITLKIKDDGDPDSYISARFIVTENGSTTERGGFIGLRKRLGDTAFENVLEELVHNSANETGSDDVTDNFFESSQRYSCDNCHQTWPGSKNDGSGLCPNCR